MKHITLLTGMLLASIVLTGCGGFSIGINGTTTIRSDSYSAPLDDLSSAEISIAMPFQRGVITPLAEDAQNVFEADVEYIGEIAFEVDDGEIRLQENNPDNLTYTGSETLEWDIRLNPSVPMALMLVVSSGEFTADLRPFTLTAFEAVVSSGTVRATLPPSETAINGNLVVSSGRVEIEVSEGGSYNLDSITVSSGNVSVNAANGSLAVETISVSSGDVSVAYGAGLTTESRVEVSSGTLVIEIPEGVGVRIEADDVSSGDLNLPDGYTRTAGDADSDAGTWESAEFAAAETQITLTISISSGSVTIR